MTDIEAIDRLAADLAAARAALGQRMQAAEDDFQAVRRRHGRALSSAVGRAARAYDRLHAAVEAARALFAAGPRTRTLHGIRLGLVKGRGQLVWDDEAALVARIKAVYGYNAGHLLKLTETPIKARLSDLPAADLKRLGVRVVGTEDQVFIKVADSEIDKRVAALLGDLPLSDRATETTQR
ncbi:MAG: hypothetical protein ACE5GS_17630 [Kiloniellaceae bacterium]